MAESTPLQALIEALNPDGVAPPTNPQCFRPALSLVAIEDTYAAAATADQPQLVEFGKVTVIGDCITVEFAYDPEDPSTALVINPNFGLEVTLRCHNAHPLFRRRNFASLIMKKGRVTDMLDDQSLERNFSGVLRGIFRGPENAVQFHLRWKYRKGVHTLASVTVEFNRDQYDRWVAEQLK